MAIEYAQGGGLPARLTEAGRNPFEGAGALNCARADLMLSIVGIVLRVD